MSAETDQAGLLRQVTELTIHELIGLLGWQNSTAGRLLAHTICRPWAARFARHALDYNDRILTMGWSAASRATLQKYVRSLTITGAEHIPTRGPLLVTANHPLISDFMALAAATGRDDLSILAYTRPFLRALPGIASHMILMSHDPGARSAAVREVIDQLNQGRAVLFFPAGIGEPDPEVTAGLPASLAGWRESLARVIRQVRQVHVMPALVSGVTWSQTAHLGIVRSRSTQRERMRVGGTLQVMWQTVTGARLADVKVHFGRVLCGEMLVQLESDRAILDAIRNEMRGLLATLPTPTERTVIEAPASSTAP
jgi:hypothetical protein